MSRHVSKALLTTALTVFAVSACSSSDGSNEAEAAAEPGDAALAVANNVTGSLKALYDITTGNIKATAEMVPEELYSYQPTDEVRTMGQIIAHVAGAQFAFCSAAAGEANPSSENYEETATDKASIMAALDAGVSYCDEVYTSTSDARGQEMIQFFGQDMAVSGVLAFNAAHNYEHYGNLVTYMRINGMVPPSSGGM